MMVCKVAQMLVQRGQALSAAAIMQRQARLFLSEGWLRLGSKTLQDLLECHTLLYQVCDLFVPSAALRGSLRT